MAYNQNITTQQLQDLSRQYQQLLSQSNQFAQPQINSIPQATQVPIPIIPHQVQYVEGIKGARLYQDSMQPNSSEIIMDRDENIFYQVSKDANGTPSKRIIKGTFTIEAVEDEEKSILTRKDFDEFKDEIRQLLASRSTTTTSAPKTVKKE